MSKHLFFSVMISAVMLLVACGDDDDSSTPVAGQGGAAAGATANGTGGRAGSSAGRSGSGSDTGNAGSSGSVQCGSTTCATQGGGLIGMFAMACCADPAKGTCGMSIMGAACSVPSAGDSRCPIVQAFGGISIPGCCTSDGMCGLDASMFGFGGCTELGAAAQQAGAMGMGMGGMIPPPRRCDDSGSDAGVSDAGA